MEADAVRRAYKRWAPVYDNTFGKIADAGRQQAVNLVNGLGGRVLEVGLGTGMSLPTYDAGVSVTGIDLSTAMLAKARKRVEKGKLTNVEAVLEMDAAEMDFADGSFDVVVAMYVLTVVPDPKAVMSELNRVCKPGGDVVVLNHFSSEDRIMRFVEKTMSPFSEALGWRPQFPLETVLGEDDLTLVSRQNVKPGGLFSLLRFRKSVAA
jgi:phosphatidylethanolamine/phosphatidyl-N-methylethanolamine N-methyltransferase